MAAALNNPDRSVIGNPRKGTYAVRFVTNDMDEALELARLLAGLHLDVHMNCKCDETGVPMSPYVNLYDASKQKQLFELVESELNEERRQQLEDLVLARGPIPPELLERIRRADQNGWSPMGIADEMNERGIIAGMGGHRWTAKKVTAALAAA